MCRKYSLAHFQRADGYLFVAMIVLYRQQMTLPLFCGTSSKLESIQICTRLHFCQKWRNILQAKIFHATLEKHRSRH